MTDWETVVGLEVHVQLATRSKLFCGCAVATGAAPNSNVCPVCLGLPGALPVPNAQAVRLATRAALALGCEVRSRSVFARKNYFYPDLPKGYQISQFDQPLAVGGRVRFDGPEGAAELGLVRLHLEEDAGKLLHDRFPDRTAVDLNRAGTPLAEIVTEPTLRGGTEARAFLTTVRQMLRYAGVSDCNMEEGSLRVDANISLRRPGAAALGTKTEVKNMNSFANVERAIDAEAERQRGLLEGGGRVTQVTLLFDAVTGAVRPMRSKEESHDYRYFPDPDLPVLVLAPDWVDRERRALPEMAAARRARFGMMAGLSAYDAEVLTADRAVADHFEAVVAAGADPKTAANWVMGEGIAGFNVSGRFAVDAARLAGLIALVDNGTVSLSAAKRVHAALGDSAEAPLAVATRLGLLQERDDAVLVGWVDEVIAGHPAEVARARAGERRLVGFLVGQVMKLSRGSADPKLTGPLIERKLG